MTATHAAPVAAETLLDALCRVLPPDRVRVSALDRIAFASDASCYRLIPQAVVRPISIDEVQQLFALAAERRVPLTFRAAGTSLSGQAITDGVLVDLSRHWRKLSVEDGGARVRAEPGVIGAWVNRALAPYGRRMGPDPASINACMMGGIIANNSSGMCCGVRYNAYHTLDAMTMVLPDGTVWDTARDAERFATTPTAHALSALARRIRADVSLVSLIRRKYAVKNTTGYGINAFVDYDDPLAMLAHLMVGSEGTLGFIAEVCLRTVADPPFRLTGLFLFPTVTDACAAVEPLSQAGAAALELMDRASLSSVQDRPGIPPAVKGLPPQAAALLVEFQAPTADALAAFAAAVARIAPTLRQLAPPLMAEDAAARDQLWHIRKGMYPSVGAMRDAGTTVITEDFAVPVEALGDAVTELQGLFARHGYASGIVFGHARDGNLHFVMAQSFNDAESVAQYAAFMNGFVDMVVRHGGSLKAEHGTGRNMAPFVEREWGTAAVRVMRELKSLLDPVGFLNPGVVISDDPNAHLHHLKDCPRVMPEVDRCLECGFCEPRCPSRDLTMTPRQRIVAMREVARGGTLGEAVRREFGYAGEATCAADGMCATACPVSIDTGKMIKRLRAGTPMPGAVEAAGTAARQLRHEAARWLAARYAWVELCARFALRAGHLAERWFGGEAVNRLLRTMEVCAGARLPRWLSGSMPRPASSHVLREASKEHATPTSVVYFPSCISHIMGSAPSGGATVPELMLRLARRAGVGMRLPRRLAGRCCGMPFSSKGYDAAGDDLMRRTVEVLREASEDGRWPVVVDNSSCASTLRDAAGITVIDAVEFVHDTLMPRLTVKRKVGSVAVHPVCSTVKMGIDGKLLSLIRSCAERAEVPAGAGCCGTAGDRGFMYPELTHAATRMEATALSDFERVCASNRTCEVGLSHATGREFESFLRIVDEATR